MIKCKYVGSVVGIIMTVQGPIELRGDGDEYRLDSVLASLKERGCSILVAGTRPATTSKTISQRLFGHPEERRERVLLRLRQTVSLEDWFPAGVDLDDPGVRIVDCIDPGRSAVDDESRFDWRWDSKFDPSETPALSRQSDVEGCIREIESAVARAGTLEPSQLRVGVFSLGALDGPDEMVDVVSSVSSTVTSHRGMVHYHLQQPATSSTARTMLDHVDAMITVRKSVPGESAAQKWTIPGYGKTPWIPLSTHE